MRDFVDTVYGWDDVFQEEPVLCAGLVRAGLEQQRRALRLMVNDLKFEWPEAGVLRLGFSLQSGSYATTVLRECFDFS